MEDYNKETLINTVDNETLLSILLGNQNKSIAALLEVVEQNGPDVELLSFLLNNKIKKSDAVRVLAALEFSKRFLSTRGKKISTPEEAASLLSFLNYKKQECFASITLNAASEVINVKIITVGLINFCQVHPREVFVNAITDRAVAIIVGHNHPSGNLEPSKEDIDLTKRLREASKIIGIELIDHLIISRNGFFSFKKEALIID